MQVNLSPNEISAFLEQLYDAFDTGFDFENFLKVLLHKIGLEEVEVTRKSRDGGIDLKALRRGVEGLSNLDDIPYVVQAKRLRPGNTVAINDVRALRGVMKNGEKGMFITTGKFTADEHNFSRHDETRPIVLIYGKSLVIMCVQHEIGFVARPQFNPEKLQEILGKLESLEAKSTSEEVSVSILSGIPKSISLNDIRARILPVPSAVVNMVPIGTDKFAITFPLDAESQLYPLNRARKFVSGVTDAFRRNGLISKSGEFMPTIAYWSYDHNTQTASLTFTE